MTFEEHKKQAKTSGRDLPNSPIVGVTARMDRSRNYGTMSEEDKQRQEERKKDREKKRKERREARHKRRMKRIKNG